MIIRILLLTAGFLYNLVVKGQEVQISKAHLLMRGAISVNHTVREGAGVGLEMSAISAISERVFLGLDLSASKYLESELSARYALIPTVGLFAQGRRLIFMINTGVGISIDSECTSGFLWCSRYDYFGSVAIPVNMLFGVAIGPVITGIGAEGLLTPINSVGSLKASMGILIGGYD